MAIRAVTTGTISLGLVAIPVRFFLAASDESVRFNQFTPDDNRVRQKLVDAVTGEEVPQEQLRKGYEYAKGQWVIFSQDELKALENSTDRTIRIEACVPLTSLDIFQTEKSYYLGPDKGGDRAYCLLVDTLSRLKRAAVAQWSTKGREYLVVIRPYKDALLLQTLYYADEVRDVREVTCTILHSDVPSREHELAKVLIEKMSFPELDLSAYRDGYRDRVLEAVDAKVKGKEIVIPTPLAAPSVVDLFDALKASIEKETKKGRRAKKRPAA